MRVFIGRVFLCPAYPIPMLDLSIIVPVYNVAVFLPRCIDSLLAQDLPAANYEIIIVDDGSTDNSPKIADSYAGGHDNIIVRHQSNAGLSEARNAGIDLARGRYVMFVDSDDFLQPDVLNTIVSKMDSDKLDVLRFNYQNVNEKGEVFEPNKVSKPFVDYRDVVCDGMTFLTERLGGACYACMFALKRELTNIRFTPGRYFEDMLFTPAILLEAKRVTSINLMVYNYFSRSDSITKSVELTKVRKRIEDRFFVIEQYKSMSSYLSDKRWFNSMIAQATVGIMQNIATYFYVERNTYLQQIRNLHLFPLRDYHATRFFRRKLLLANLLGPRLFCYLLHIISPK